MHLQKSVYMTFQHRPLVHKHHDQYDSTNQSQKVHLLEKDTKMLINGKHEVLYTLYFSLNYIFCVSRFGTTPNIDPFEQKKKKSWIDLPWVLFYCLKMVSFRSIEQTYNDRPLCVPLCQGQTSVVKKGNKDHKIHVISYIKITHFYHKTYIQSFSSLIQDNDWLHIV